MKKLFLIWIVICASLPLFSQEDETERWREAAYQAKLEEDYTTALDFYRMILEAVPDDYDARLALGRLYNITGEYRDAISIFDAIYREDPTDVEAMNGLGAGYEGLGKNRESVFYYEQALNYLPDDFDQLFKLAEAYENNGDLDKAIDTYRSVIRLDDTWAEAWAGIGKMYYWQGKPFSAANFYEKALELDPENTAIKKEYLAVRGETDYSVSLQVGPVNEQEENYQINAMISKAGFEKRLNDHFHIQAGSLLDYSNRNYTDDSADTTRWYDNTWIKGKWLSPHHTVALFGGYSITDSKFSSYGFAWNLNYNAGKVDVKNALGAGYDYFYYWNRVGSSSISDELKLSFRFIGFNAKYGYGVIDPVLVNDFKTGDSIGVHTNPYQTYSLSLEFRIVKRPEIKVGFSHSYLDYKYKSPLYYSPYGRNLTGALASLFYGFSRFYIYGNFAYNLGTELTYEENNGGKIKEDKMNVDNWSASMEIGYDYYPFSVSLGGNSFYNPYYQSISGFIAVKVLF